MARIKVLKDEDLAKGTSTEDVYPVSTTQALYSQDSNGNVRMDKTNPIQPEKLEDRLEDHEEDALELHRKVEKLVPTITANSSLFEITGNRNTVTFTGSAVVETPGDEPNMSVPVESMTAKTLTFPVGSSYSPDASPSASDSTHWAATYKVPDVIGSYTGKFEVTYNGVNKQATTSITSTVRQYYGFVSNEVISQGNSAVLDDLINNSSQGKAVNRFTSSIGSNVSITLPANGTGTKYTYFAIPSNMTINKTIVGSTRYQYPLNNAVTVSKSIGGVNCTFKLYKSVTDPECSEALELIINPT